MPNVILEAMAAARPVVATGVGGVPELVKDGMTGFLVPPQNEKVLTDSLLHLLSDTTRREAMGLRGREYMEKKFDISTLTRKLESIYMDLSKA